MAKSDHEAAHRALHSLNFIREVWNWFLNRSVGFRRSMGIHLPVNKILLGPIHTLHDEKGRLATEDYWYEPDYSESVKIYNPSNKIDKIYSFIKIVRAHLKRVNYDVELENAIVRYGKALDLMDWENSYLQLWGVLEQLTDTTNESYKVTIRRTSFFFSDREYHQQILTHLRDYRNRVVHAGTENQDIEAYIFQLKRYVEKVMEFLLGNRFGFNNISHAAEFMDMPVDLSKLDSKIKMLRNARKWLSG